MCTLRRGKWSIFEISIVCNRGRWSSYLISPILQLTKESSSDTNKGDKNTITLRTIEEESMEQGLLRHNSQDSEYQKEREDEDQGHKGKERLEISSDDEPAKTHH